MESPRRTSQLTLAPFRPSSNLASTTVLPAIREVVPVPQARKRLSIIAVGGNTMAIIRILNRSSVVSQSEEADIQDVSSSNRPYLTSTGPRKRRTPLPNARSLGTMHNGTKRSRSSPEADIEADVEIRPAKRLCQGRLSPAIDTDLSLKENKDTKPPFTYVQLAKWAILSTPECALSLNDIYAFIGSNFAYYRFLQDTAAWQKSIRHALRTSKAFQKTGLSTSWASTWEVKAEYR